MLNLCCCVCPLWYSQQHPKNRENNEEEKETSPLHENRAGNPFGRWCIRIAMGMEILRIARKA